MALRHDPETLTHSTAGPPSNPSGSKGNLGLEAAQLEAAASTAAKDFEILIWRRKT
jgi:hypothetical protein